MITLTTDIRELVSGTPFSSPISVMPAARRGTSPIQLTSRGTGVSGAGPESTERNREVYRLDTSRITLSATPAPSSKSPLLGVRAWRPPVL